MGRAAYVAAYGRKLSPSCESPKNGIIPSSMYSYTGPEEHLNVLITIERFIGAKMTRHPSVTGRPWMANCLENWRTIQEVNA